MTFVLAGIVFVLTIAAILCMHSALSAGRDLQREIERVVGIYDLQEYERDEDERIRKGRER